MTIRVIPLGAGQDVGRSCVVVSLGGRNVMFDCGMHMGYTDHRRFPDFTPISPTRSFTAAIDALLVSHFHLDHCGALPYLTEQCGYAGPIVMSEPTRALCPVLLEDYRRITVERKGEQGFFTQSMIEASMRKVQTIAVHQSIWLGPDFEVKAYYAGHVLGATMFMVRVGAESVVYTGDYNMTPDRHLGAAWIDCCRPDLLITESTYATTTRSSKRARERNFLRTLHDAVAGGGKVLIPVFALGRVQELCLLVDEYWEQMMGEEKVPVYFSGGMAATATSVYQRYLGWTSEQVMRRGDCNPFNFKHVQSLDGRRQLIDLPGPMVLFSTPGMLHSGGSLEVFRRWCGDPKNVLIIPGYCVAGTVGAKLLAGQRTVDLGGGEIVQVGMQVRNLSFSAHADAKGILQLIHNCRPRAVMLVHGEAAKMTLLAERIKDLFGIDCYHPANGQVTVLGRLDSIPVALDPTIISNRIKEISRAAEIVRGLVSLPPDVKDALLAASIKARNPLVASGYLDMQIDDNNVRIRATEASPTKLSISTSLKVSAGYWQHLQVLLIKAVHPDLPVEVGTVDDGAIELSIRSFTIRLVSPTEAKVSWLYQDDLLARHLISLIK